MLLTVVAFVVVLGVLIFVHELGHFIAAKWAGIGVPRFSIGFGPATPIRFRRGETEYVVAWFPLGGYVKMASREEQEAMSSIEGGEAGEEYPPQKLFEHKSLAARATVLFAGVAMNALFAWVVYAALAAAYGRPEDPTTSIARVDSAMLPAGAAALARIRGGAKVIRINGDTVRSRQQMEQMLLDPVSPRIVVEVEGESRPIELDLAGLDSRARLAVVDAIKPMWEPRIGRMTVGMPAHAAGLRPGDLLVAVNGDTLSVFADLQEVVDPAAGDTLVFTALRGDSMFEAVVVPQEVTVEDPSTGESRVVGRIGVDPEVASIRVRFSLPGAVLEGGRQTVANVMLVLGVLKGMLVGAVSVRDLGGPILIGQVAGEAAQAGIVPLLFIMAFLSVNLAVLNLLPIPVLDGGHLVFLLMEGLRGKPLSLDLRLRLTQLGMLVLVGIMLLAFANDFMRLLE
ncbi:MAG: RIP metalloprotease RseP [Gemmatimonadales bacterium]